MNRVVTAFLLVALGGTSLVGCGGAAATPSIGTPFGDPEGAYTIQVDPKWEYSAGGLVQGVEIWFIGPAEGALRPNLNLLTQSAPGVTLADYVAISIRNAPSLMQNFTLVSNTTLDADLALMEYTASPGGTRIHFLAVFGVRSGHAVVATLTTPDDSFANWRPRIEPFMRTLQLT